MSGLKSFGLRFAAVVALAAAPFAHATVVLTFDDGDLAPNDTRITAAPGTSFLVNLRLTSTGNLVSGVNYDVITRNAVNAPVNNIFRLTARSLTSPASSYQDTSGVLTDAEISASPKFLAPDTGQNLGSTVTGTGTTGAGSFQVSRLTFSIPAGTPAGVYTLNTEAPGGDPFVGYNGPAPASQDFPFDAHAVYTVTVTPEPTVLALGGVALLPALLRRRRAR